MSDSTHTKSRRAAEDLTASPSILVVDDNQMITRALLGILNRAGFRTQAFNTGSAALGFVQTTLPDAAVIDIHLPDISGLVLSYKLRERFGPGRPIIILSGDTSIENINTLSHIGATLFISKPFKADYLVARLRELVSGSCQESNSPLA